MLVTAVVRALAMVGVVVALVLGPAAPASAHAELVASTPVDGGVVERAPEEITLQFSEDVSVQPDGVRVLDASGERVDAGTATAAGSTVTAPVDGPLADGGYVVAWRVVSADGHPVRGAFSFSVGQRTEVRSGLAGEAFEGSADSRDDVVGAVLRGVAYLAVLGASGAVLVGAALRRSDEASPVTRLVGWLSGLGLLTLLLQLPVQASLVTGAGWGSLAERGVLRLALSDGAGVSLALTAGGLVAVVVTTGLPFRGPTRVLGLAGAALAPLGFVVTGHTRTMSPAAVAYLADAAHLLAAAVWLGGLGAVLIAIHRRRAAGDDVGAAEAVATFSGWAAVVVAAVVVAGATLGWIEVGGWHALTTTTYGRLLMAKVALFTLVLAGAAWNRFRLVPAVVGAGSPGEASGGGDGGAWSKLRWIIRFEVLVVVAILAVTAVLANVTPARVAATGGVVTMSAPLGSGSVEVIVDPASPGRNDVHAYLLDADGGVEDRYDTARFQLELPAQDLGPFDRQPVRAGAGHFQLVGTPLDLAGEWMLTITVKPDRFTEQSATVRFPVR
ncbi:MAG: Copper resistance protein CopC [Acidimicrobiales bacterium]|nr:Copper resistance protein CopC [Acidimicrobiales bacterium]